MNELERKYYESPAFWEGEMIQDSDNRARFSTTASFIPEDVTSLLDAGCGNGVFVNYLSNTRPGLQIQALDRSERALKFVKTKKTLGDISNLPFEDGAFDCVSCLQVIEHLPIAPFETTLDELARVAGKYLIVSVPYNEILEDSYTRCPSCLTIFNFELHLRSFDDERFTSLFDSRGFSNVRSVKAGVSEHLKFHKVFRKVFYPEQWLKWNSPICPLCGYEGNAHVQLNESAEAKTARVSSRKKLIAYLSPIPKRIWPKEIKHYWIIGLFERQP